MEVYDMVQFGYSERYCSKTANFIDVMPMAMGSQVRKNRFQRKAEKKRDPQRSE